MGKLTEFEAGVVRNIRQSRHPSGIQTDSSVNTCQLSRYVAKHDTVRNILLIPEIATPEKSPPDFHVHHAQSLEAQVSWSAMVQP